jgi:hypothetical protein
VDRNVLTLATMFEGKDKPIIQIQRFLPLNKPTNPLSYYKETADEIEERIKGFGIPIGKNEKSWGIQDFSQRTQLAEEFMRRGIGCYAMTYGESVPSKREPNKITGIMEKPIELETISRFSGTLERSFTVHAHQKVRSRIALGAYLFALFLEKGCIAGIDQESVSEASSIGMEKELCLRTFETVKSSSYGELFTLSKKEDFKAKYRFSPDIFDTICQLFYMIYVELDVRTNTTNLDFLRNRNNSNKYLDNVRETWQSASYPRIDGSVKGVSRSGIRGKLITR